MRTISCSTDNKPSGFPSGIIRWNRNDAEKISTAPVQGWHAQIEKCQQFLEKACKCNKYQPKLGISKHLQPKNWHLKSRGRRLKRRALTPKVPSSIWTTFDSGIIEKFVFSSRSLWEEGTFEEPASPESPPRPAYCRPPRRRCSRSGWPGSDICICIYVYMCIYIYIYIERERERLQEAKSGDMIWYMHNKT